MAEFYAVPRDALARARSYAGDTAGKLKARLEKIKEEQSRTTAMVMHTAEVGAAAFGFGWLSTRYPDVNVLGIDPALVGALAFHALAFMGLAGKFDDDLHSLGDGALAVYLATLGAGIGDKQRKEAGTTTSTTTTTSTSAGAAPGMQAGGNVHQFAPSASAGVQMSEAELAALHNPFRRAA